MVIWKADWFFSGFISNFKFSINNAFFIACIWSKPFPSAHPSYATVDIFILFIALTKLSRLFKGGLRMKVNSCVVFMFYNIYLLSFIWKSSWLRIIFRDYTFIPLKNFCEIALSFTFKALLRNLTFSFYTTCFFFLLEGLFSQNISHSWLFYVSFFFFSLKQSLLFQLRD